VLHALQWLLANNKYYRSIHINPDALAMLPEDGAAWSQYHSTPQMKTLMHHLHRMKMLTPTVLIYLALLFQVLYTQRRTEQETVRHSVQQRQQPPVAPPTLLWPPIGSAPINEFNTEGYISCAFPTLFSTGAADFIAPRTRSVTICNYFKHLMMYKDGRFARHPRFRYFALNTEMRWRALQAGRACTRVCIASSGSPHNRPCMTLVYIQTIRATEYRLCWARSSSPQ